MLLLGLLQLGLARDVVSSRTTSGILGRFAQMRVRSPCRPPGLEQAVEDAVDLLECLSVPAIARPCSAPGQSRWSTAGLKRICEKSTARGRESFGLPIPAIAYRNVTVLRPLMSRAESTNAW